MPILILIIPYYLTSNLENLIVCLIDVPLTYISKESYLKTIVYLIGYATNFWNYKAITSILLWVIGGVSILKFTYYKKKDFFLFTSFIFFISLSILITNKSYDHYLIQLIPFFSIFSIYFFQEILCEKKIKYKKFINVIHPTSCISTSAKVGINNIINAKSVINNNSSVGNFNMINTASIIEHNAVIKNFVTMAPGSIILGHAKIENSVFLGANCTIKETLKVGRDCIVSANSFLNKNLKKNSKFFSVGKIIKKI